VAVLFEMFLRGTRYRLIRAKTAQSALRVAERVHPEVITLDVMIPFQDGWEIFRQLRANAATRAIPVVVCSILPEKEVALALGAADFLAKPVTRQSLIMTLDRCSPS
jgi:PleD family two-component response regulator